MYIYYAPGTGLGHITRAIGIIHTLNIDNKDVILITNSQYPPLNISFYKILRISKINARIQDLFNNIIKKYSIKKIFIDVFPAGIYGELNGFKTNVEKVLVSRILKWDYYKKKYINTVPEFSQILMCEKLYDTHTHYLTTNYQNIRKVQITYPKTIDIETINIKRPFWLITHSHHKEELNILIKYAENLKHITGSNAEIIISSNIANLQKQYKHIDLYGNWGLFADAEKIISGGGFNTIEQCRNYREKHKIIPFERNFDDQFYRVSLLNGK